MIFSFVIKRSRLKALEIETAFFHSGGNPKGRTLDYFFSASHIRYNFPTKRYLSLRVIITFMTKNVSGYKKVDFSLPQNVSRKKNFVLSYVSRNLDHF